MMALAVMEAVALHLAPGSYHAGAEVTEVTVPAVGVRSDIVNEMLDQSVYYGHVQLLLFPASVFACEHCASIVRARSSGFCSTWSSNCDLFLRDVKQHENVPVLHRERMLNVVFPSRTLREHAKMVQGHESPSA
jgi:hypothetical protein